MTTCNHCKSLNKETSCASFSHFVDLIAASCALAVDLPTVPTTKSGNYQRGEDFLLFGFGTMLNPWRVT